MNIHKNLVILGVALAAILVVENMVTGYQAYSFIWVTKAWVLAAHSILVGVLIGFGLKGTLNSKSKNDNDENFDF